MSDSRVFASPFVARQAHLAESMSADGPDFIVLNPGSSLTYLTGLNFHLMERPVVSIFSPRGSPVMVVPELETAKLERLPFSVRSFSYGENPADWKVAFQNAAESTGMDGKIVGVEPTRLRFLELRLLESAAPMARFISAEEHIAALRVRKDSDEVAAMRTAVAIAQSALEATLPAIKIGVTEREVAAELTVQLLRAGSDPELPFAPIVSGGPNSANPHASPSDRPFQAGDLLVIDWGASYKGYFSDLTRTFAIGKVEPEFEEIARITAQANAAGRGAAGPEEKAESVDDAARQVIVNAGYGAYFIHRTGHGLGMEVHEAPYIRSGNLQILLPGMAFTVEPGIYLPGRGGVRVEDNVVITADGAETLSDMPRELRVLG
jgi:Xaa-Pro dipeptidase